MAAADWSLLPFDLVNRVADCFLATNDVDYYMDLRAVCSNWRSATDDPRQNPDHPRFLPRQWIVLDDYIFRREDTTRLLVNTSTGRFLRKELPLLRNYYVIATTLGGFFVLADYDYPHAAHVLNPFTGHLIHFMATVPFDTVDAAAVVGSSPTLVLLCDFQHKQYVADPDSKRFIAYEDEHAYPLIRLAVVGGMYADGEQRPVPPLPVASAADKILDLMRLSSVDPSQMFTEDVTEHLAADAPEIGNRCFLVQSAGEVLIIIKLQQQRRMKVFKMDTGREELEAMKGIGSRAIFIGYCRCLAVVNADKFPSVEANCIYHIRGMNPSADIYMYDVYKYDLGNDAEEMISEAICWLDHIPIMRGDADDPFTALQLLSSYTINVRESQLAMARTRMSQVDTDQLVEEFFST